MISYCCKTFYLFPNRSQTVFLKVGRPKSRIYIKIDSWLNSKYDRIGNVQSKLSTNNEHDFGQVDGDLESSSVVLKKI